MSDVNVHKEAVTFDERSSFNGSSGLYNTTCSRPKYKPIRIKALLDQWESDDDESEEKLRESDNDSDSELLRSWPKDELVHEDGNTPEPSEKAPEPSVSAYSQEKTDTENYEKPPSRIQYEEDLKDTHEEFRTAGDSDERQEKSGTNAPVMSQKQFVHPTALKYVPSDCSDVKGISVEVDNRGVDAQRSTIFNRNPPSGVEFRTNNSMDLYQNVKAVDHDDIKDIRIESGSGGIDAPRSTVYNRNQSTQDPYQKVQTGSVTSPQSSTEVPQSVIYKQNQVPTNKFESSNHQDVYKNARNGCGGIYEKNSVPQATTDIPPSTVFNRQCLDIHRNSNYGLENAYATDERHANPNDIFPSENNGGFTYPAPSLSKFLLETPMKHGPTAPTRPTPSFCHRSLLQTPQTKSHNEFSKNNVQTPATIFSHWSRGNMFQTPTHNIISKGRDCAQTPVQPIQVMQNLRLETPRYIGRDIRSVRRPLAEAMHLSQRPSTQECNSIYPVDHKSSMHGSQLPKIQERTYHPHPHYLTKECGCQGRGGLDAIEKKPILSELDCDRPLKENKHPNILEAPSVKESLIRKNSMANKDTVSSNENGYIPDGYENQGSKRITDKNTNSDAKVNREEFHVKSGMLDNVKVECIVEHEPRLQTNSQDDKPQAGTKINESDGYKNEFPPSVGQEERSKAKTNENKVGENVQFTLPSRLPQKASQGETITVKGKEYLVLGKLGQGMSGEVLRVSDITTGEMRAVKCVNLSLIEREVAQGCLEEVSMLHRLQAPCIVTMFDYEVRAPNLYVVMEMGDTDLSRLLKSMSQGKRRPLTMILYYWTEILTAVNHIHENGVIHSDLKPANFLLVKGRLKLIDFGIASNVNADMTSVVKTSPIGTLNYISPEALMDIGGGNGSGVDSPSNDLKYKITYKSDVWSLGCILYSLIYGRTPFEHIRGQYSKINAITSLKPQIDFPPPCGSDGGASEPLPPILVDVIRRCLQRDPKARPTVAELLKVPYIACGNVPVPPQIPPDILFKIKRALTEDEWRQLTEILERSRPL